MIKKIKLFDHHLIKTDFYTTKYFLNTIKILNQNLIKDVISVMQFKCFHKEPFMVAGVYECIEIIKHRLSKKDFKDLEIYYYGDGSIIKPNQCVLSIKGQYKKIAMLENILDGILARRSSVATNCYNFLKYLKPEQIVYMADRSDDYHLMPYDGYSAYCAGIYKFSNTAHVALLNNQQKTQIYGSIPHALIQQFNGDILETFKAYKKTFPNNNLTMLVDYDNDIIDSLEKLKDHLNEISAIRVDTSNDMMDKSLEKLKHKYKQQDLLGANAQLFFLIRKWLDDHGFKHIKIICSSNNHLDKIKLFKQLKVPVDYYGIGSALNRLSLHFTADLVMYNNELKAKKGRTYISTKGMKKYQNEKFSF